MGGKGFLKMKSGKAFWKENENAEEGDKHLGGGVGHGSQISEKPLKLCSTSYVYFAEKIPKGAWDPFPLNVKPGHLDA